jgi:hypothetical protein
MIRAAIVLILTVSLTSCVAAKREHGEGVVLPSPRLIGCKASACSQLWQDISASENAKYPTQVTIDLDASGISGVMAKYDKSISIEAIRSSIDSRFRAAAYAGNNNTSVKLWRLESEKLAIGLAADDDGVKQVTYLAIKPNAKVFEDWVNSGAFGGVDHEQAEGGTTPKRRAAGSKAPCADK